MVYITQLPHILSNVRYEMKKSAPVGGTFTSNVPYIGKIVSVKRIVGPKATGEVCHITIDHEGKMPYYEGQSYGVIPPGVNPENRKPHSPRLYSIASTRLFLFVCYFFFSNLE